MSSGDVGTVPCPRLLTREHRAIEGGATAHAGDFLHEGAGTTWVGLELQCGGFAVAERNGRRLLGLLTCAAALRPRGLDAECGCRRGDE